MALCTDRLEGLGPANPVNVDGDEPEQSRLEKRFSQVRRRIREFGQQLANPSATIVDLEGDDEDMKLGREEDESILENEIEHVDLTADGLPQLPLGRVVPSRNPEVDPSQLLESFIHGNTRLQREMCVELPEEVGRFRIQFLKVKSIIQDPTTGKVALRGLPLTRTRYLNGQLPRKRNEVCLICEIDEDDPREPEEQAQLEVTVKDFDIFIKRELRQTNACFPAHRYEDSLELNSPEAIEEKGPLVCRWRYELYYHNAAKRKAEKPFEFAPIHLRRDDADSNFRVNDEWTLDRYRGFNKIRGGSFCLNGGLAMAVNETPPIVDLTNDDQDSTIEQLPGQKYSFGDIFCGAGGASRGMERAGFRAVFGVDHWEPAYNTYMRNFKHAHPIMLDVFDFLMRGDLHYRVDVLHLSPPCQVWSPAHTTPGKNDDANIAVLYSCTEVIRVIRPRIFTVEQTFGILRLAFEEYFNALIQGFTCHGYSIRWKVVDLASWGLPGHRKRLIIIGACPGEKLPPFPDAAFGEDEGLKPFRTVYQAISPIKPGDANHNPEQRAAIWLAKGKTAVPYDDHRPVPYTITASNSGHNYHPSGTRSFTDRELANIQDFPRWHRFVAPSIRRQIGNAVPPGAWTYLYVHLRKWLENVDGVVAPAHPGGEENLDLSQDLIVMGTPERVPDTAAMPPLKSESVDVIVIEEDEDKDENEAVDECDSDSVTLDGDHSMQDLDDEDKTVMSASPGSPAAIGFLEDVQMTIG